MVSITTVPLPRAQIAQFITTQPGIKAFENLQSDAGTLGNSVTTVSDSVAGGSFLVLGADSALGAARVFTPVAGELTGTDGAGAYTLGLADSGVTPGVYGGSAALVNLTVDAKGRVTAAGETTLSATAPLTLADGVVALQPSGVAAGTYENISSLTIDEFGRVTAIS